VEGRRIASAVVWGTDLLVTVASAVAGFLEVRVWGSDGAPQIAKVVGWDGGSDLAVLRLEGANLKVPDWSEGESLKVGNITLALGRPGGRAEPAWGIVRDLDGAWQSETGGRIDRWIEVDGSLPRGFPGGPLVDATGKVVGINSRFVSRGGGTVPTVTIRKLAEILLTGVQPQPGYLGAAVHPVELDEGGYGLMVLKAEGPAAKAGIRQGDVLLQMGDLKLGHPGQLLRWLADGKGGKEVQFQYRRAGETKEGSVTLGTRPSQAQNHCCG
jgi:S1-C subfamily serine protease